MLNEQLIVKYIPVQNCFIYLPNAWIKNPLTSSQIGVIRVINNEIEYYIPYKISQSISHNLLCINATFAKSLNIIEGTSLNVSHVPDPPIITTIIATAQSEHDLTIIQLRADKIQEIILHQINVVAKNQTIIIWLSKGLYVTLIVNSIIPNFQYGKLEQYTEVHILDTINNQKNISNQLKNNHNIVLPVNKTNSCIELLNNYENKMISPIFRVCFTTNFNDLNVNDELNTEIESLYNIYISLLQSVKFFPINSNNKFFFCNMKILPGNQPLDNNKNHDKSEIVVRIIIIDENTNYLGEKKKLLNNIAMMDNNNIIVSQSLKKQLQLQLGDKINLIPITIIEKKITQINILPSDKNVSREMFENYFHQYFAGKKLLINSGTKIFFNDHSSCRIQLLPENCTYGLLNESKINNENICCLNDVTIETLNYNSENNYEIYEIPYYTCLEIIKHILFECRGIFSMSINTLIKINNNFINECENILICGNIGGGKSTICKILNEEMQKLPYYFYTRTIECRKLKGKKFEMISKLFTTIMNDCKYHQPSILFIDDLESITNSLNNEENSPDAINAARIADIIINIITNYQSTNSINILATCTSIDNLGNQLRSSRGVKLFRAVMKIPDLTFENRCDILKKIFMYKLEIDDKIQWEYYGSKTEGWTPQDLVDLAEKAAFIAWKRHIKEGKKSSILPTLDNEDFTDAYDRCKPNALHGVTLYNGIGNNWSDIGSLNNVKDSLIQLLQWPLIYSELFKNTPINQQSGVLLYGMPGTGKTMIAGAIAKECGLNFINIKGPELLSKYIGASEEAVRNIFRKAQRAKPCVLFFDEFESLAPRRGHDSTGVTDRVVNQLLTEFDGVEGREGVAIVAASSRPDLLDPALLRPGRLDKSLLCPLPNDIEREEILEALCKTYHLNINELNLKVLAQKSINFTGADLNSIFTQAQMNAFEKNNQLTLNVNSQTTDGIKITQDDLMESLKATQPSLTVAEIAKFHEIYRKFSSDDGLSVEIMKNLKSTLA